MADCARHVIRLFVNPRYVNQVSPCDKESLMTPEYDPERAYRRYISYAVYIFVQG